MNTDKTPTKSKLIEMAYYIFHAIFRGLADVAVVILSSHTFLNKIALLYSYTKMWLKTYILYHFFSYSKEQILNFKIYGPTYKFIYGTFRESFVRGNYWFYAQRHNPTIFDCGANIGMATLYWKWLYPDATIYSFEPNPEAARYLRRNIKTNSISGVNIYELALGKTSDMKKFYIHQLEQASLKASLYSKTIGSGRTKEITVKVNRLSKFVGQKTVDLLKLDIEAGEYEVIDELNETGKLQQIKEILIECHVHIPHTKLQLGKLLFTLESNGFGYQLTTDYAPLYQRQHYQDVMVYAYRS